MTRRRQSIPLIPVTPAHRRTWQSLWRRCSCGLSAPCVDRLAPAAQPPFPPRPPMPGAHRASARHSVWGTPSAAESNDTAARSPTGAALREPTPTAHWLNATVPLPQVSALRTESPEARSRAPLPAQHPHTLPPPPRTRIPAQRVPPDDALADTPVIPLPTVAARPPDARTSTDHSSSALSPYPLRPSVPRPTVPRPAGTPRTAARPRTRTPPVQALDDRVPQPPSAPHHASSPNAPNPHRASHTRPAPPPDQPSQPSHRGATPPSLQAPPTAHDQLLDGSVLTPGQASPHYRPASEISAFDQAPGTAHPHSPAESAAFHPAPAPATSHPTAEPATPHPAAGPALPRPPAEPATSHPVSAPRDPRLAAEPAPSSPAAEPAQDHDAATSIEATVAAEPPTRQPAPPGSHDISASGRDRTVTRQPPSQPAPPPSQATSDSRRSAPVPGPFAADPQLFAIGMPAFLVDPAAPVPQPPTGPSTARRVLSTRIPKPPRAAGGELALGLLTRDAWLNDALRAAVEHAWRNWPVQILGTDLAEWRPHRVRDVLTDSSPLRLSAMGRGFADADGRTFGASVGRAGSLTPAQRHRANGAGT